MSALDGMLATLRALDRATEEAAQDVAALLGPRMKSGHVEARGEAVAIVPGGRSDAFLSEGWAADVQRQAEETLGRIGGGR